MTDLNLHSKNYLKSRIVLFIFEPPVPGILSGRITQATFNVTTIKGLTSPKEKQKTLVHTNTTGRTVLKPSDEHVCAFYHKYDNGSPVLFWAPFQSRVLD